MRRHVFVNHTGADCSVRIRGHRSRDYELLNVADGESVSGCDARTAVHTRVASLTWHAVVT